jgi:PmbA protein
MTSLFDQSGLTKIAERLVEAALRHGADAADAVAVRGISQSIDVRDGSVEESQRSEGDNVDTQGISRSFFRRGGGGSS